MLVIAAWLLIGAIGFRYLKGEPSTFENSFYLSTVTFLTIGYGDFAPTTGGGKVFTIFFIILSLVVQTVVGGYVLSKVAGMDTEDVPLEPVQNTRADSYFKLRPKLVALGKSFALLILFLLGLTFLMEFAQHHTFLDALYFSVVTLSTVGYGDIHPDANRGWFAVYFIFGVLVFGYLVGQVIGIMFEVAKLRKMQRFFSRGLTEDMLDRMDDHKDGKIHRYEFLIFMLKELGLATTDQIRKILLVFDSLNMEKDDVLDINDVRRHRGEVTVAQQADAIAQDRPGRASPSRAPENHLV